VKLFFTTKKDLLPILAAFENSIQCKYIRAGRYLNPTCSPLDNGASIPDLGKASNPSSIACDSFLICEQTLDVKFRSLQSASASSENFFLDQLINPDSVILTPGGMWDENILLHGRIATASTSEVSARLLRGFENALKRHSVKVKAFYVGAEALGLLKTGWRLTAAAQSPPEYDLAA
jgi:hypothetical protein